MYPDIQQKVYEEVQQVFGKNLSKSVTMQDLNNLNYLELVIKETLRLFPSVPFFGRNIFEDMTFGDVTIPANTSATIAPYYLGRDPKIFPEPLKFDPSRFDKETNNEKNNPYAYVPFSAGKETLRLSFSTLLLYYRFRFKKLRRTKVCNVGNEKSNI